MSLLETSRQPLVLHLGVFLLRTWQLSTWATHTPPQSQDEGNS